MNTAGKVVLASAIVVAGVGGGYWYLSRKNGNAAGSASLLPGSLSQSLGLGGGSGSKPNAAGQTVSLQAPSTGTAGASVTIIATGTGFQSPVYQFWVKPPAGAASTSAYAGQPNQNGWYSWYGYGPNNAAVIPTPVAGTYAVIAYAREASAPTHETTAERSQYEANSAALAIQVG